MDITGLRRSARIANKTVIRQAIKEENRLFLRSPHLLKQDKEGNLKIFSTQLLNDLSWFASGARFYKVTQSGYLVFDRGAHGGERPEEEEPEPQPRAIYLYEHLGVIYRRTQSGEGKVEEDIHIVPWDDRWLADEFEEPIQ